jgi:hypothetical protein
MREQRASRSDVLEALQVHIGFNLREAREVLQEYLREGALEKGTTRKAGYKMGNSAKVLKEAVYGNMATVFHRTSVSDLVNKVFDSGFKPGDGAMYGKGFYSTYELESQLRANMSDTYGPIVVKFACPISTFFIFDYEEFKKSPNFKKLNSPSENEFLKAQFDFFKMDYSNFDFSKKPSYTSETALWCTKNIPNFKKLCEGIVFTGSRDGKVLVSYNTNLIYPLSYSTDEGKTWKKVEKNREYLKKVAKVKSRFIPEDLLVKPENFGITNYDFDENGFLNVFSVNIPKMKLNKIPFKFGKVDGYFNCSENNLTSLKGAPQKVDGYFDCSYNNLTSLKGAPQKVGGYFDCCKNDLTYLEGAPQKVGGSFYCSHNNLTSLKGAPQKVGRDFDCNNNNLTSLEGAPKEVGGYFDCAKNNLTSLEGAPQKVGRDFDCSHNNLTSLKGAPQKVDRDFDCNNNNLTSLEGAPQKVDGDFYCANNKTKFTKEDVKKVCEVGGLIYV